MLIVKSILFIVGALLSNLFISIYFNCLAEAAYILGGLVTFVKEGDLINITCIVDGGARIEPPEQLFWYHQGKVE